jgi:hypothetical protein
MRRSARFWLLKNIAIGAFEYDPESSPISVIRSAGFAQRSAKIQSFEVRLRLPGHEHIRLNCHPEGAASTVGWNAFRAVAVD